MANVEWRREDFFVAVNSQAWNTKEMVTIVPGESILRVRWGIQLTHVSAAINSWPTGDIVCKAGIVRDDAGIAVDTAPTPITNPGDDWLDMCFLPFQGVMERTVNVGWAIQAQVQQRESRERRDLDATAVTDDSVYLCWEWLNGTHPGATVPFERTGTVDALILMP